jgi:hypothetical protein
MVVVFNPMMVVLNPMVVVQFHIHVGILLVLFHNALLTVACQQQLNPSVVEGG